MDSGKGVLESEEVIVAEEVLPENESLEWRQLIRFYEAEDWVIYVFNAIVIAAMLTGIFTISGIVCFPPFLLYFLIRRKALIIKRTTLNQPILSRLRYLNALYVGLHVIVWVVIIIQSIYFDPEGVYWFWETGNAFIANMVLLVLWVLIITYGHYCVLQAISREASVGTVVTLESPTAAVPIPRVNVIPQDGTVSKEVVDDYKVASNKVIGFHFAALFVTWNNFVWAGWWCLLFGFFVVFLNRHHVQPMSENYYGTRGVLRWIYRRWMFTAVLSFWGCISSVEGILFPFFCDDTRYSKYFSKRNDTLFSSVTPEEFYDLGYDKTHYSVEYEGPILENNFSKCVPFVIIGIIGMICSGILCYYQYQMAQKTKYLAKSIGLRLNCCCCS